MPPTKMSRAELDRILRRAGITERRSGGHGGVFSEPVLLLMKADPARVYDQDGRLLATFRAAPDNPSFWRRVILGTRSELVDRHDQLLLRVSEQGRTFHAVGIDGNDLGTIRIRYGWRKAHSIEVDEEIIGSFRFAGSRRYRVLGANDVELGRISHHPYSLISKRNECNVIEIDDAMPETLRRLMPVASKAVFHLMAQETSA